MQGEDLKRRSDEAFSLARDLVTGEQEDLNKFVPIHRSHLQCPVIIS